MQKFVKDVLIFFMPIIMVVSIFGGFYFLGYCSGELKDIDKLIKEQRNNHSVIIGLGYNEQTAYYKLQNANYYQAEVISLGTSRAMQFKADYFKSSFYNLGGAVSENYDEYKNFLENLNYVPDMILLDLDAWVFNSAWNNKCAEYQNFIEVKQLGRNKLTITKTIMEDFVRKKWNINDLNNYSMNEGFNGKINDNGFLYDGSLHYGDIERDYQTTTTERLKETFSRIDAGNSRFEYGTEIDTNTIEKLELLLNYCADKHIYVIGYLAPFAPSVYSSMINSGNYDYLQKISPACQSLFDKYSFAYFNYADGNKLKVTDDYFADGFHGSEIVYGLMIQDMINQNTILKEEVDIQTLNALQNNAYSSILFINPDERIKN